MNFQTLPLTTLGDERINIRLSNLPPGAKVKISASMCFPWVKDVRYESLAWFTADASGNLDLSKQKPDSGSYDGIDSMGPILFLKRVKGEFKDVVQNISVDQNLWIDITAECGQDSSGIRLERLWMGPELKSLEINQEFFGKLFYTEKSSRKTIIFLGGSSNEDLTTILPLAALMASHGFNVLALA